MTGLEVLIEDVCPYMLAEWINRIDDAGVFSREYIQQMEDWCDVVHCRNCWEKFLNGELPKRADELIQDVPEEVPIND